MIPKVCARCKSAKDVCLFGKDKNRRDGLNVYCKHCVAERSRLWSQDNRERRRAVVLAYGQRNSDKIAAWRKANSESLREYWKKYGKQYRAENGPEVREKTRREQAARRRAVPPWFDREKAVAVYQEAERRRSAGEDVEVDHIVPINGQTVCGLHWHGNLRILPASVNRSRGNRLDEEAHNLAP